MYIFTESNVFGCGAPYIMLHLVLISNVFGVVIRVRNESKTYLIFVLISWKNNDINS